MRRARLLLMLIMASLGAGAFAQSQDFEFESSGSCSANEARRDDKLTLSRGVGGLVRARITFYSFCVEEDFTPKVEYLDGQVRLSVERSHEISLHCACTSRITFRLKRPVPRGTTVVFGFGSQEPLLRAIAP